ncbi:inhibitor of growth protein 1 isoform X2 [Chrysoperla carnea]|uniref:inhibitor of growth protein 1 isoform X2 n=1 Tax=Chrysoperla carnea TaxID=189513 RepID=UPI001D07B836|nr:inhibitor of growth protein 1 isoform X2 [Chrysoperla carnea]
MLSSHVSLEAMYSTTYVENYLDCVENLPDDLQRLLSRLRELDCTYPFLREVEQQSELLDIEDPNSQRKTRRIQKALIAAQELGDEKLQVVQQLQDLIENRTRRLDLDFKNLDYSKEEASNETKESQVQPSIAVATPVNTATPTNERQSKRARRTRQETLQAGDNSNTATDSIAATEHVLRSSQSTTPIVTHTTQKKTNTGTGKKKKRKTRGNTSTQSVQREESPPREDESVIDPDEPTYCLCDQISFGEMILCDNDLCPIEWFHFSCVALTTKPKGKWFCPKCRGDRPNVMKPKAQFLKELERYNKEKEEKT